MEKRGGTTYQKMLGYILKETVSIELAARYTWTGRSEGSKSFENLRVAKCMLS